MNKYVVRYRLPLTIANIKVDRFERFEDAEAFAKAPDNEGFAAFAADLDTSSLAEIGSPLLVDLYNAMRDEDDREIKKFENRKIARDRFFARLGARFHHLSVTEVPAKKAEETSASTTQEGETELAKTKKAKAEKKPRAKTNGAGREVGKPAGLVADFGSVREGTDRAKVLKLMDGSKTAAQIAKAIEKDEKTVMTVAYCLHRDCAIGYKVEDGKLLALYPGQKTFEDALKKAAKAD